MATPFADIGHSSIYLYVNKNENTVEEKNVTYHRKKKKIQVKTKENISEGKEEKILKFCFPCCLRIFLIT